MISKKLHYKISFNRLIFASMNEVMLTSYLNSKGVKDWDSNLALKLKNIKGQLERSSASDFKSIEELGGLPATQLFYTLSTVFEKLFETANQSDPAKLENLIMLMDAFLAGEEIVVEENDTLPT